MGTAGYIKHDVPVPPAYLPLNLISYYGLLSFQQIQRNVSHRISALASNNFSQIRFGNGGNRVPGDFGLRQRNTVNQMGPIDGGTPHLGKGRRDETYVIGQFIHECFGFGTWVAAQT